MREVEELSVTYGRVTAVSSVSFSVDRGATTLLLGSNGAGKSSTLGAVAGAVSPTRGRVLLDGVDVFGRSSYRLVRAGVVLVPEGRRVFAPLTVEENLRWGGHTVDARVRASGLARAYELFPVLEERRHSAAGYLSGGEQQMLAFARALMSQPQVVLVDEPSLGLAPIMIEVVMENVRRIAAAGVVVLVEQNAEVGLASADEVVVLARGAQIFSGTVDEARSNAVLIRAFFGETPLTEEAR